MALEPVCEAALLATALNVWLPLLSFVVSSVIVNGAVVTGAPEFAPSTWNWTLVVFAEALAVTETLPETVAPDDGEVMDTVGAVGGGGGGV
jgi:hypothetical protein